MTLVAPNDAAEPRPTADTLAAPSAQVSASAGLSAEQRRALLERAERILDLAPGEILIEEGAPADALYLVESGSLDVLKRMDGGADELVARVGAGDVAGELALIEPGPRSATVIASGPARVHAVPLAALEPSAPVPPEAELRLALASAVGRRLRRANERAARLLRDRLDEMTLRSEMGRFLSRVLLGLSLYVFAMGGAAALKDTAPTSLINLPILIAFAAAVAQTIWTGPFPPARFGLTLRNWRGDALDALLWSLPVMAAIVALKAALVAWAPETAGETVFDLQRGRGRDLTTILGFIGLYCALVPMQELVARCGIQSSLQMYLSGPRRALWAVVLSNILFSVTHMHVGIEMALFVLPAGMFWGWLFWRRPSLVGVSVSHALIGVFAFFVVGFPFVF